MKVQELMTRDVRTCRPQQMLNEAARAMWEGDIGCVPVVDEQGKVVGMITDRDICMAAYTKGRPISAIPIESVMTKQVVSCQPGDDLATAERLMQKAEVRRLPVVRLDGRLDGILSLNDLALQAARERTAKVRAVGAEEVAATLAAICKHRTPTSAPEAAAATARPAGAPAAPAGKGARSDTLLAAGSSDEQC
jgi:CBS domain-containing protein